VAGIEILFGAVDEASPVIQRLSKQLLAAAQKSDRFAGVIEKSTTKVDAALSKLPPKAKQAKDSFTGLSGAAQQLKSQLVALVGAAAITAFFKSSVTAAAEEEKAVFRLNKVLQQHGDFSARASQDVQAWARTLQETTGTADDQVLSLFALARGYANTSQQAVELTETAIDFAVAADINVTEAIRRLGRAIQGSAADVGNFAPEIKKLTKEQLAAGEATRLLGEKFKGTAAELQRTFSGELVRGLNDLDDFKQEIGEGLIPALRPLVSVARFTFQQFRLLGTGLAAVAAEMVAVFELRFGTLKDIFKGTFEAIRSIVTGNMQGAKDAANRAAGSIAERTREFTDKSKTIWSEFSDDVTKILDKGGKDQVQAIRFAGDQQVKITRDITKEIKDRNKERLEATTSLRDSLQSLQQEELELSGQALEAARFRIKTERDDRLAALNEIAEKAPELEDKINAARLLVLQNAALAEQEALEEFNVIGKQIEEVAVGAANTISDAFAKSVADSIVENKKLQIDFEQVMKQVARTAIEQLIKIAIQAAITRAAVGAASGGAADGGGGGIIGAIFGGLQHGGIATKPVIAGIAEKEPEAVIPLSRLGSILRGAAGGAGGVSVTVQQTNHFTASGMGDEEVRQIMRRISLFTRAGAAEGAELVKSILARQGKVSGLSV